MRHVLTNDQFLGVMETTGALTLEVERLRKCTAWLMKMASEGEEPVFDWKRDRESGEEFIRLQVGVKEFCVSDDNFCELVELAMEGVE